MILGLPTAEVQMAFDAARQAVQVGEQSQSSDLQRLVDSVSTRLGLSAGISKEEAARQRRTLLRLLADDSVAPERIEVLAWHHVLRFVPERVPTLDRPPVVFPPLPGHQQRMWTTILELERSGQPWVLVGGQMTMLHCLENDVQPGRATDDGDIVLNVWTRRESLRLTTRFLRDRGYSEDKTSDGYGYRFRREGTDVIDILLPEGLERQRTYPTTSSGRPGLSTLGANQALSRAERVPVTVGGVEGHLRRPNLLGAIVVKAHAFVTDSRDVDRHAEDIVTLAGLALRDPRATLSRAAAHDRKPVRSFVANLSVGHRYLRPARDPEAVLAFLNRLAG